jgi:hypothetical protein
MAMVCLRVQTSPHAWPPRLVLCIGLKHECLIHAANLVDAIMYASHPLSTITPFLVLEEHKKYSAQISKCDLSGYGDEKSDKKCTLIDIRIAEFINYHVKQE